MPTFQLQSPSFPESPCFEDKDSEEQHPYFPTIKKPLKTESKLSDIAEVDNGNDNDNDNENDNEDDEEKAQFLAKPSEYLQSLASSNLPASVEIDRLRNLLLKVQHFSKRRRGRPRKDEPKKRNRRERHTDAGLLRITLIYKLKRRIRQLGYRTDPARYEVRANCAKTRHRVQGRFVSRQEEQVLLSNMNSVVNNSNNNDNNNNNRPSFSGLMFPAQQIQLQQPVQQIQSTWEQPQPFIQIQLPRLS